MRSREVGVNAFRKSGVAIYPYTDEGALGLDGRKPIAAR